MLQVITDSVYKKDLSLGLYTPCEPVTMEDDVQEINDIVNALIETTNERNALGCAANQIGYNKAIFVMAYPESDICRIFINPVITVFSEKTLTMEEGCLSYPDFYVKIKRPIDVAVDMAFWSAVPLERRLETCSLYFSGMNARVIQHEMDHLNGVRFFDHASRYHLDQALQRYKILKRRTKDA